MSEPALVEPNGISIPHQIECLQVEIASYEKEIQSLQGEIERIERLKPRPQSDEPNEITRVFKSVAEEVHRRTADLNGLKAAIAHMKHLISDRQQKITLLRAQQAEQQRLEKLESGKAAIRAEMETINRLAGEIEERLWQIKRLWKEHDALQYSPKDMADLSQGLKTRKSLVRFLVHTVPVVSEEKEHFQVSARTVPLFQEEQREWTSKLYSHMR